MSLSTRMMNLLTGLPPAETRDLGVDKGLEVPMADGAILRADRHYPRNNSIVPTLLVRTPYGRGSYAPIAQIMAERGFQVVVQSCRGCDDSDGVHEPFRGEREDGLATLDWLKQQPWFDGRLGMQGPSYLGYTQWALARDAGPELKAISTSVTSSEFYSVLFPAGTFNLAIFLDWLEVTESLKESVWASVTGLFASRGRLARAKRHLPLGEADVVLRGAPLPFWRNTLAHPDGDAAWWGEHDYSTNLADVTVPNHMTSGWFDFMLPQLLRDYTTLQRAGRNPYLTIGPWSHSSNGLNREGGMESYLWLRGHLLGEMDNIRKTPVRIFVMGADEWREMPVWPPPEARPQRWHLLAGGGLGRDVPRGEAPSHYTYDPTDPTPNIGGPINEAMGWGTGPRDNRRLEARADVLCFTTEALATDVEVIGPVSAELFVQSSAVSADFFVRLCDVLPNGRSMNVCDGIQRVVVEQPGQRDASQSVTVQLWPTAHRFRAGHRIRVQVSSGAFPRYPRNLGTGEPLATGTAMVTAEQKVYHDPAHPSAVVLPVM